MFNTESIYFRTEGDLANSGRSNGIQGDAIRNITGNLKDIGAGGTTERVGHYWDATGIFSKLEDNSIIPNFWAATSPYGGPGKYPYINLDVSKQIPTANEIRVKNRLIRIYKLLTINGKKVSDIIGA